MSECIHEFIGRKGNYCQICGEIVTGKTSTDLDKCREVLAKSLADQVNLKASLFSAHEGIKRAIAERDHIEQDRDALQCRIAGYQAATLELQESRERLHDALRDASECVRKMLNGDMNPSELDPQGWDIAIKGNGNATEEDYCGPITGVWKPDLGIKDRREYPDDPISQIKGDV